ncbi:MAG: hypothetical protein ABI760_24755 [Ferruginibacter sp.]
MNLTKEIFICDEFENVLPQVEECDGGIAAQHSCASFVTIFGFLKCSTEKMIL